MTRPACTGALAPDGTWPGCRAVGIRTRKLRAGLSALGIAIGVAAIVAVLGLSASSQAGLLNEINKLGTNLLTVTNGQTLFGQTAELPQAAPGMIGRIGPVIRRPVRRGHQQCQRVQEPARTVGRHQRPLGRRLEPGVTGCVGTTVAQGEYLNSANQYEPVAVLGAAAAQRLGIDHVFPGERIWIGGMWFYVIGILNQAPLTPEIDSAVLVGFPAAETYLGFDGHPSEIYLRAQTSQVNAVVLRAGQCGQPGEPQRGGRLRSPPRS